MAAHKSIAQILEDYKLQADNFRRMQDSRLAADAVLSGLNKQIQRMGMKVIEQELAGSPTDLMRQRMEQLSVQKMNRIKEIGGRKYLCDKCRDTGISGGRYCRCLRSLIYRGHYGAYDPARSSVTLDTYDLSCFDDTEKVSVQGDTQRDIALFALRAARDMLNRVKNSGEGMFLHGEPGLGKSWLAGAMARSAAEAGIDIAYIHAVPMFALYHRERLGQDVDTSYLETAELLLVDDLGAEPMTANVTVESLLKLITYRLENGLPSVFVTNQRDIQRRYGERISSRIMGKDFVEIQMRGRDLRDEVRWKASE